ncbi:hypothetical protein BN133_3755 [Cronobacter dublinensis 582]|nr:hypothetical protein BN133_3755 [Cronobacter dublinensis 582]
MLQKLRLRVRLELRRRFQHQLKLGAAEIVDGNNVFLIKRISHFCLLFRPADKRWTPFSPSLRGFYQ